MYQYAGRKKVLDEWRRSLEFQIARLDQKQKELRSSAPHLRKAAERAAQIEGAILRESAGHLKRMATRG